MTPVVEQTLISTLIPTLNPWTWAISNQMTYPLTLNMSMTPPFCLKNACTDPSWCIRPPIVHEVKAADKQTIYVQPASWQPQDLSTWTAMYLLSNQDVVRTETYCRHPVNGAHLSVRGPSNVQKVPPSCCWCARRKELLARSQQSQVGRHRYNS
jgi:hypothetical protein